MERIFEFIDQNVKKNTLNSNDVQRERERERVISDFRKINSAVKKFCHFWEQKICDWMNIILLYYLAGETWVGNFVNDTSGHHWTKYQTVTFLKTLFLLN